MTGLSPPLDLVQYATAWRWRVTCHQCGFEHLDSQTRKEAQTIARRHRRSCPGTEQRTIGAPSPAPKL